MAEQEIENITTEMSVNKDESDGAQKDGDQPKDKDENMEEVKEESPEDREDGDKTESEEKKERKVDPKDWPLRDIKEPHENDVLFGRGGGTNHAKGNKQYRKMVEDRKLEYVNSKRLDKPLVALEIIRLWRAQDPPGRFLKMDNNGLWYDVGDKKAREKTSQALREKAPLIRKQQEEEKTGKSMDEEDRSGDDDEKESTTKNTRFAEGTTKESKGGMKKAVLARDHSLGREYLQAGETMTLDGFSWRDPIDSQGSRSGSQGLPPPGAFPPLRNGSGSLGMAPSEYRVPSVGPPPQMASGGPPPPGGYYTRTPTDEYQRSYQQPPMMPGYAGYGPHQRSGSWTHGPHAMPPLREHSLAQNPLRNASASHPAPVNAFEPASRAGSGYWADSSAKQAIPAPAPGLHPYAYPREGSGHYYNPPPPPSVGYVAPSMMPPPAAVAPPYAVDPAIARTWSGQSSEEDIAKTFDKDFDPRHGRQRAGASGSNGREQNRQDQSGLPRPEIVKRMTSNQNETLETKPDLKGPSVKRAALNRDNSLASNRLKAEHLPEYYNRNGKFDAENEVSQLTDNLEQSTLDAHDPQEQTALSREERKTTLDNIAMDLMVKPPAITENSRSSTVEALALDDLDSDPVLRSDDDYKTRMPRPSALSANNRMSTMEACFADLEEVTAKPLALTASDRISTRDYLDLGDDPLTEGDFDRMYEERANA